MKNLLTILFSLIFVSLTRTGFAQKIEVINHGQSYLEFKEMSYYDFKDKCSDRSIYVGGYLFPYVMSSRLLHPHPYAGSIFPGYLSSDAYSEDIKKLCEEFDLRVVRGLGQREFEQGTKKVYESVHLYLERFEIISEYHKELHNYNIDKKEEREKIRNQAKEIDKSIVTDKRESKGKMGSDSELNKLIADKKKSINEINNKFNKNLEQIEIQKQSEIKGLQMSNYTENKNKIINKYNPKIAALKKQKNEALQSAKPFWDDKINTRKKELEKIIANEISEFDKTKVQMQSSQRQEIKSKNNLNQKREEIEANYKNAISEINKKISTLIAK